MSFEAFPSTFHVESLDLHITMALWPTGRKGRSRLQSSISAPLVQSLQHWGFGCSGEIKLPYSGRSGFIPWKLGIGLVLRWMGWRRLGSDMSPNQHVKQRSPQQFVCCFNLFGILAIGSYIMFGCLMFSFLPIIWCASITSLLQPCDVPSEIVGTFWKALELEMFIQKSTN